MAGGWFPRRGRGNVKVNMFNLRFFRFNTLRIATNNFSTLLGRGGYGNVYKGVLPDDGTTVAIKIFYKPFKEFLGMVEVLSHLRHINLIQVIGCCMDNGQQLLVYEFAENGNVCQRLHNVEAPAFDWESRASVCLGVARGLSYLHHEISPRIIHCDIKPSNILLDANFVPKIVDFDLIHFVGGSDYADGYEHPRFKHLGLEYSSTYTTTVDRIIGTYGYMDPYYVSYGALSPKTDVYSFGVTMLVILSGRRPYDAELSEIGDNGELLHWVTSLMKDGMVSKIVDQKLTDFPKEDVERFINVALWCTDEIPEQRPIMLDVVQMLYRRHKSDQEISDMATRVIADRLARRNNMVEYFVPRDSATSIGVQYTMEVESREEPVDETSSVECAVSAAALAPLETSLASSSKEDQSCPDDLAGAYFERSMEKIMRYHIDARRQKKDIATLLSQTMVITKSSANMFKEAVYPPYLSGEFHRRPSHF